MFAKRPYYTFFSACLPPIWLVSYKFSQSGVRWNGPSHGKHYLLKAHIRQCWRVVNNGYILGPALELALFLAKGLRSLHFLNCPTQGTPYSVSRRVPHTHLQICANWLSAKRLCRVGVFAVLLAAWRATCSHLLTKAEVSINWSHWHLAHITKNMGYISKGGFCLWIAL